MSRTYVGVEEVAERYGSSVWTVYDLARRGKIPHRKPVGQRRLLFITSELDAFDDGAQLGVRELRGGGRVVKPIDSGQQS